MILESRGVGKYREETVVRGLGTWAHSTLWLDESSQVLAPALRTLAQSLAGSRTRNTTQSCSQVSGQFWHLRYQGLSATLPPVSSGTLPTPTEAHSVLISA